MEPWEYADDNLRATLDGLVNTPAPQPTFSPGAALGGALGALGAARDTAGQALGGAWQDAGSAVANVPGVAGVGQSIGYQFDQLGTNVSTALDLVSRPQRALSAGAYEALNPGADLGSVLSAAGRGLAADPNQPYGMSEVLGQMGVPEGPSLGPVSARDVAGFAGDILTDPTNLIPGVQIRHASRARGLVDDLAKAMPDVGLPRGIRVSEDLVEGFQPTPLGHVMQETVANANAAVARVTEVANNLIAPRTMAAGDPIRAPYVSFQAALDDVNNQARIVADPLQHLEDVFNLGADGRITLANGTRVDWGDVFEQSRTYAASLSQEQRDVITTMKQYVTLLRDLHTQNLNDLAAVAPETAERFRMQMAKLAPGADYFPRVAVKPDDLQTVIPIYERHQIPGSKSSFEKDRKWLTREEARAEGIEYPLSPFETVGAYTRFIMQEVAEMQFAKAVAPLAKQSRYLDLQAATNARDAAKADAAGLKELQGALNRVLRGENIPPATMKRIEKNYPHHVQALKDVMGDSWYQWKLAPGAGPNPGATAKAGVPGDIAGISPVVSMIDRDLRAAEDLRKALNKDLRTIRADSKAQTSGAGLQEVQAGYLRGLWFRPEDGQELANLIKQEPAPWLAQMSKLSDIQRTLATGLDFSGGMIQGLTLLTRMPDRWLKAQGEAFQSLMDPAALGRYFADPSNQFVLREVPGLATSGSEFYAGAQTGGLLERGLGKLGLPGAVAQGGIHAAERAFTTFGTVARVELAKALYPTFQKEGRLRDLGEFVNHMTGAISSRGMGISPTQRAIEGTFLLFAPRYVRASLALVGDILSGGLKGQEAAKSLASMATVGNAMYQHAAHALGQEPILNPKDGRFMTVEIDGQRIGVGSIWVALTRTLAKTVTNPTAALTPPWIDTANPLVSFWRARLPLIPGAIVDTAIFNETLMGTPLQTPGDFMGYLATKHMPFWVDALITDRGKGFMSGEMRPGRVLSTPAEIMGARVFPRTRADAQNEVVSRRFPGRDYETLNPIERAQVENDPTLKSMPLPKGQRFESLRSTSAVHDAYVAEAEKLAEAVNAGTLTKSQFREALKEHAKARNTRLADIEARSEPRGLTGDRNQDAYRTYISFLKARDLQGNPDYAGAEEYLAHLPEAQQTYINQRLEAGTEYLGANARPLVQELRATQEKLDPYWSVRFDVYARRGILKPFLEANPAEREALLDTPRYRAVERLISRQRENMRRRDPALDQALVDWYGFTSIRRRR